MKSKRMWSSQLGKHIVTKEISLFKESDPEKCLHHVMGYPPSSKRKWEYQKSIDSWSCYCCREASKIDKDITIFNEEDIKAGLDRCPYCNEKLVPKKERIYYIECAWCKGKIYI